MLPLRNAIHLRVVQHKPVLYDQLQHQRYFILFNIPMLPFQNTIHLRVVECKPMTLQPYNQLKH